LDPSTGPLVLSRRKPQPLSSETNGWEKRQDASEGLPMFENRLRQFLDGCSLSVESV
jgi:hypothetical protein